MTASFAGSLRDRFRYNSISFTGVRLGASLDVPLHLKKPLRYKQVNGENKIICVFVWFHAGTGAVWKNAQLKNKRYERPTRTPLVNCDSDAFPSVIFSFRDLPYLYDIIGGLV